MLSAIKSESSPKTERKNTDDDNETINQIEMIKDLRSLEERRRSLLDHHWAIPSKER